MWNDRLMQMIEEADVFQLFWSSNAMRSEFVRQEWEHALSLNRPYFIRPTYWEDPLPMVPEENLPPEPLRCLHFQRIAATPPETPPAPPPAPPRLTRLPRHGETPAVVPPPAKDFAKDFELMKRQLRGKLIENLDLSRVSEVSDDARRTDFRRILEQLCSSTLPLLNRMDRERLIEAVLDEVIGGRPIAPQPQAADPTPLPSERPPEPPTSSRELAMWGKPEPNTLELRLPTDWGGSSTGSSMPKPVEGPPAKEQPRVEYLASEKSWAKFVAVALKVAALITVLVLLWLLLRVLGL